MAFFQAEGDKRKDIELPGNRPTSLLLDKHIEYILNWTRDKHEYEYCISEHLRMSGVYWCVTAMDLMHSLHLLDRSDILAFVESCLVSTGGFSAAPSHDAHLLYTLSAIQILITFDALEQRHIDSAAAFIASLQLPDGSFQGDKWGEVDSRFAFCALAALKLINRLDGIRLDDAVAFVQRCMNFDGGFGCVPGTETHSGQIYCGVGALAIANRAHLMDSDLLGWWLCERQLPSGGFNGRPEKLPDVCYSWWVLSSLKTINRLTWIDRDRLIEFILACQDDQTGGFADRPGDMVDPFHTVFGLAALSLLGYSGLEPINSIFCMTEKVIQRVL